uniref:Protein LURP-one-related 8 n=1 Tax=Aegilops tauschii subsp. strangulata TaxID=200361 RepID=A0A453KCY8_AEGTS
MSRIHPNAEASRRLLRDGAGAGAAEAAPACYTVWMRSSMGFQGTDGFSVYDAGGELAFRVDNYSRRRKIFAGELTLMDGHGAPLLSLRPQIISMHDQWNCYKAPEEGQAKRARSQQLFSVRKCSVLQNNREAEVYIIRPWHHWPPVPRLLDRGLLPEEKLQDPQGSRRQRGGEDREEEGEDTCDA